MSLNKLIRKIKSRGEVHPSINKVGVGNRYDLFGYNGRCPYLWIINDEPHNMVWSEGNHSYNQIEYTLTLRVGDYVNNQVNVYEDLGENSNNELDVSSDTAWILSDIINIMTFDVGTFGDYVIEGDISIIPFFREEQGDLTGHEASVTFRTKLNPCATTIK